MGITARQGPASASRACRLAGWHQLGHDARCAADELGRGGELDGGAPRVAGPAGRLGRSAVQPNRLVARCRPQATAAPRCRARAASAGSAASVAASSYRRWASLGIPRAKVSSARRTASSWASARRSGWPAAQPSPARRSSATSSKPAAVSPSAVQPGGGRQAPAQVAPSHRDSSPTLDHPLRAVLPDRLQHPVARPAGTGDHHQQAVVGEAGQRPRHLARASAEHARSPWPPPRT